MLSSRSLPHHAGAAQAKHILAFRQFKIFVAERELDDEKIRSALLDARHEGVEIRALGLVRHGLK